MYSSPQELYLDAALARTPPNANPYLQRNGASPAPDKLDAVIIRDLTFEAGRGRNKKLILNRINMTVPEGAIYGLLGPSGCGKTTMLRCLVGRVRPRHGSVLVFGLAPGNPLGNIPGRDIGYMPQEISIYEDFTIEETLRYFGKINRLRGADISERIEFLIQFLDLPSKRRLVVNLSGGQKRRVSLAAALVHSPPLLILDEPTVGVDPLLRQSIWRHLVTLTERERISVIITTHYIEEARQAHVVGLMRQGRILAEDSPDRLMRHHQLGSLEEVFLKLCVTDSARRAAALAVAVAAKPAAVGAGAGAIVAATKQVPPTARPTSAKQRLAKHRPKGAAHAATNGWQALTIRSPRPAAAKAGAPLTADDDSSGHRLETHLFTRPVKSDDTSASASASDTAPRPPVDGSTAHHQIRIDTATGRVERAGPPPTSPGGGAHRNEALEVGPSSESDSSEAGAERRDSAARRRHIHHRDRWQAAADADQPPSATDHDDHLACQAIKWATRRGHEAGLANGLKFSAKHAKQRHLQMINSTHYPRQVVSLARSGGGAGLGPWWKTLMAVTWKNYLRLRRNPPVLVFQFMLPAIQVILFCLCIGGEPFDVPVAVVNEELVPRSSTQFLDGLNPKIIRQIKYDNLSSAIEAVKRGKVWGAIHIPDKYSQNLQSRLIMGEEATNDTIRNGTIVVYPDLTNLHLALALETTFRETFVKFARDSVQEMGYDRSLAGSPIQMGKPVYGTLRKDGYLEFMAPGVVISISYVMATGLTALAFILERRDGLLERSLVSGVQTSQILLAHAINQVVVMVIQIFLVLGCVFFVFEIPSRGPFFWVVLLILLQGCTGMGFGLLVSAICTEENTAVMMLVGTFYTNLILAGIIWPIEAMPHWIRPLSYAQPQTLPTDTLRHILSRGWGITEGGVVLGFVVTIGWLVIFLLAAGLVFKYSG